MNILLCGHSIQNPAREYYKVCVCTTFFSRQVSVSGRHHVAEDQKPYCCLHWRIVEAAWRCFPTSGSSALWNLLENSREKDKTLNVLCWEAIFKIQIRLEHFFFARKHIWEHYNTQMHGIVILAIGSADFYDTNNTAVTSTKPYNDWCLHILESYAEKCKGNFQIYETGLISIEIGMNKINMHNSTLNEK